MGYMRKLYRVILTYFFGGYRFKIFIYLKRWERAQNCEGKHLKMLTFCLEMVWFRKLHSRPWPTFWRIKIKIVYISKTVIASAEMHSITLLHLDIYQRMIPVRYLHLLILTYFLRSNIWNCNISETTKASASVRSDFEHLAFWQHFSFLKCKWSLPTLARHPPSRCYYYFFSCATTKQVSVCRTDTKSPVKVSMYFESFVFV